MRPNMFRFDTDLKSTPNGSTVFVPPRYYEHGFDGQTAWEACPGRPTQKLDGIFGVERQELAECFAWCAEPQDYRSITNLGECDFHGRRCYELELVRKSGNPETHYYDLTNHLLAGIVRSSVFGPSLECFIFGDYREFGGFKFPARIDYRAEDERDGDRHDSPCAGLPYVLGENCLRAAPIGSRRRRQVSWQLADGSIDRPYCPSTAYSMTGCIASMNRTFGAHALFDPPAWGRAFEPQAALRNSMG